MFNKPTQVKFTLMIISILAFSLRFYQTAHLPAILNRDEAALAYNAYLLQTAAKDEWGRTWPLTLESFGDYKLPGYPTLLVFLFKILPLNDLTVRLPSILAGTCLVLIAFAFAKHFKLEDRYALLFAFLIAITPIFFFYSRSAWEANIALTLLITSLLLILKNKSLMTDLLAIIIYLAAILVYNTPLLLLPFIILLIPLIRGLKNIKHWLFLCVALSLVLIFGLFNLLTVTSQKSAITIFADETIWMQYTQYRDHFSGLSQTLFGNKYLYWLKIILINFYRSFSIKFLLTQGGQHPWHSLAGFAHIYWITYLSSLAGLIYILLKHQKDHLILLYLLIISLLPAVITVDAPHATRSLLFFFVFSFFSVIFWAKYESIFNQLIQKILKLNQQLLSKRVFILIIILSLSLESFNYFKSYFTIYPKNQLMFAPGFDLAVKELEKTAQTNRQEKIAIVDGGGYQYILLAWYLKIPAKDYLTHNVRQLPDKIGMKYGEQVLNYHFIAQETDRAPDEKTLLTWENNQWIIKTY